MDKLGHWKYIFMCCETRITHQLCDF